MFNIHPEHAYVRDYIYRKHIDASLKHHPIPTITCYEKAGLLDWPVKRIIKALYVSNGASYIGIVTPETGKEIDFRSILHEALKISKTKAKKFHLNRTPKGMTYGTCSPFPYYSSIGTEITKIIILDPYHLGNTTVDISMGGYDEDAFKTSMHLPYNTIYDILKDVSDDFVLYFKKNS